MRLLALFLVAVAAQAQDVPVDTTNLPPNTEPYEVVVLRDIYDADGPLVAVPMRVVNTSAYPVYFGAAPALWAGSLLADEDLDPALRLTVAQAANFGLTFALKNLVRRPRPYVAVAGVTARDRGHQGDDVFDPHSFPSGHTSSAFVIATSVSLSYPEWYVVAPAAVWAGLMGVTRVWHGVHYPSDVLVGAAIGTVSGAAVHFLLPRVFGEERDAAPAMPVRVVIPL
ncbi:phosphatase PAP2 family protein [Rubrivirga sp.]|uniref:phosphatase PAP2 family protein n=1 Tax=Rubrivirga sp. TaxID=1885344 RepID=UPI003B5169FA